MITQLIISVILFLVLFYLGLRIFDDLKLKRLQKKFPEDIKTISKPVERLDEVPIEKQEEAQIDKDELLRKLTAKALYQEEVIQKLME